jgi:hypothetical protein
VLTGETRSGLRNLIDAERRLRLFGPSRESSARGRTCRGCGGRFYTRDQNFCSTACAAETRERREQAALERGREKVAAARAQAADHP